MSDVAQQPSETSSMGKFDHLFEEGEVSGPPIEVSNVEKVPETTDPSEGRRQTDTQVRVAVPVQGTSQIHLGNYEAAQLSLERHEAITMAEANLDEAQRRGVEKRRNQKGSANPATLSSSSDEGNVTHLGQCIPVTGEL